MSAQASRKSRLLELMIETGALRRESVTLSSGERSIWYLDSRKLSMDPESARLTSACLTDLIQGQRISHATAVPEGATPLLAQVVLHSANAKEQIRGFLMPKNAKEHGITDRLTGHPPPQGEQIAVIEDVTTTGRSLIAAAHRAVGHGLSVALTIAILERAPQAGRNIRRQGYHFEPLLTFRDIAELLEEP